MAENKLSTFNLHKHQTKAWDYLDDPSIREVTLLAGIQGGKTSFGALAMLKKIREAEERYPGANFLVTADNYKTLSQATVPTLRKVVTSRMGEYKQGKEEIHLKKGGVIYIRTGTDPYSVEGIPDVYFAWMDEAGKCSRVFQTNVLGRVARLQGQTLYTSTPYAMNWLYRDVEKPWKEGTRKDIALVRFSSSENPSFPKEEFERQRALLDPQVFAMKYMGLHSRMQGLIYQLTSDNLIKQYYLPQGTQYYAGVDFGFVEGHEFALSVRAITPNGLHQPISTFKKAGLDPNAQVDLCRSRHEQFHVKRFFCDPARPDIIALLQKAGLPAVPFHESAPQNENYKKVVAGIQAHQALINSKKYKIIESLHPDLMDEYETYHWSESADGEKKREEPHKDNDHFMDAERYITVGTLGLTIKEEKQNMGSQSRAKVDTFNPRKKRAAGRGDPV